ncbi:MAG: TonB-dependent receptor plug domain-containing protein [Parvibaculales bacterium]
MIKIKVIILVLVLGVAPISFANGEEFVNEIIVSATGIPTTIGQLGVSVDVITAEDLRRNQITYLQDALKLKAINVPQYGGRGTSANVFLRGLPGKYTALEVDGISLFDPNFNQVLWQDVVTDNVEQIEILRGSQSILYGSSTIAGVISQFTAIGSIDGASQSNLRLEAGSFATSELVLSQRGAVGALDYGWALGAVETDGISAATKQAGSEQLATEKDGYENTRFNGRAQLAVSDNLTFDFAARYAEGEVEFDGYDAAFMFGDKLGKGENFTRQAGRVGLAYQRGNDKQTLDVSFYDSETEQVTNFVADDGETAGRDKLAYRGIFGLEQNIQMVLGAEIVRETLKTSVASWDVDNEAIYALVQAPLGATSLTLAARLDDHEFFGNHGTHRLTLAYAASEQIILRGSYGTGFKSPTLYQLFNATWGNSDLQPEKSDSREIGLDYIFGQSAFGLTFFEVEIDNLIDWVWPDGYAQSDGTRETEGVELSFDTQVTDRLSANLSGSYIKARESGGQRAVRVPQNQATMSLFYQLNERLQFGLGAQYVHDVVDVGGVGLDDYTLYNVRAHYQLSDAFALYGRIENAGDKTYETVKNYGAPGRAFYMGINARF